ncbi:MAG TPA: hypothetical protein VKE22_03310 [Haliangiales bacterium]|nr:hypothetical protein [Haliangiales bacterium]
MIEITTEERAFAAAVARTRRAGALAALPAAARARCEEAARAPADAARLLAEIPADAPAVEAALAGRGRTPERWLRWLRRRFYGHLVDMPPGLPDLVLPIEIVGRRRLALATKAAPRGADRLLASRLAPEHAAAFLVEVAAPAAPEAIGAAVRELAGLDPDGPIPFTAGARHLGPAVAAMGGDWPRRVAQRLPRPLGERLLGEVAAGRDMQPGAEAEVRRMLRGR